MYELQFILILHTSVMYISWVEFSVIIARKRQKQAVDDDDDDNNNNNM